MRKAFSFNINFFDHIYSLIFFCESFNSFLITNGKLEKRQLILMTIMSQKLTSSQQAQLDLEDILKFSFKLQKVLLIGQTRDCTSWIRLLYLLVQGCVSL